MTQHASRTSEIGELGGRILVGIDLSPAGHRALLHGLSLAREKNGRLYVLHVIDGGGLDEIARLAGLPEADLRERIGRERRTRLETLVREIAGGEPAPAQLVLAWGRPFEQILKKAEDVDADLIVLGTSGQSADLERALFGSTAEKVLRSSTRPVLCVPAD